MQYRIAFLAALSATGALAAPAVRRQDDNMMPAPAPEGGLPNVDFDAYPCPSGSETGAQGVTVILSGLSELQTQTPIKSDNGKFVACPKDKFNQFALKLDDADKDSLKALRCVVFDDKKNLIGATRGANTDLSFSDGGEAKPWDFLRPASAKGNDAFDIQTSKVVCDKDFEKITPEQLAVEQQVNVLLREQAGKDAKTIGPFKGPFAGDNAVADEKLDVDENVVYATIEIAVGRLTNPQGLRCATLNKDGNSFFAKRDPNIDLTFSDADKGEWTFGLNNGTPKPTNGIQQIVCNKDFKANNVAPQDMQAAPMTPANRK